jgi:hypothetical protein
MPKAQAINSKHNKHPLQGNEKGFILDQLARVTFIQLITSIRTSCQDQQDCSTQTAEEKLHFESEYRGPTGAEVAEHIIAEEATEYDDDYHLKGEACQG